MPGLLDITDDPNTLGLLSLGLRLMSTPGKFGTALGQAGMGALGDLQQARQMTDLRKLREQQAALQQAQELRAQQQFVLQQQLGGLQLNQAARADDEARAQKERDDAFIKSLPSPQAQALQALGTDASPTMANAARMPAVDPRNQFLFDALQARQIKPMEYLATQKDSAPIRLGANERLLDPRTNRVLVDAMPDPAKLSPVAQLMTEMNALPPGDPRRAIYQSAINKATTHQPATTVTVQPDNLGLKPKDRFEMEQKLGQDFTNATKQDRAIISTAQDISGILQQGGALKDQAAIYKFAKALDPDGAVREADYAAIVRTAGGLDYVKALFNKALTGEQLSTNQRAEMSRLMQSMAAVAQARVDRAKERFGANAKLYNLNPDNVFQSGTDSAPSLQELAAAELARRQGRK